MAESPKDHQDRRADVEAAIDAHAAKFPITNNLRAALGMPLDPAETLQERFGGVLPPDPPVPTVAPADAPEGPDGSDKDFWIVITIGGAALGAGLYFLGSREWWFGSAVTVGSFVVLAPVSPFVRRATKRFSGRPALWALGAMTWLFLAANIALTFYPLPSRPDPRDATIAHLEGQLEAAKRESAAAPQRANNAPALRDETKALTDAQKRRLIEALSPLKSMIKTVSINRSNYTKGRLWSDLVEVFNRAGFGDANVQSGFQEPSNTSQVGVMICTPDTSNPRSTDILLKELLHEIGIESRFIPLSDARYSGDLTIFVGPDPL